MPRIFALFLCGLGALIVATTLRQSSRARQIRSWTRTTGRVLQSRVEPLKAPAGEEPERFAFVIRYAYEARGQVHESEQVWIGSGAASVSEDAAWPRRWVERFPAGSEVPVWFEPSDPRQAVLVRDIPGAHVAAKLLVGGALAAFGFFVFVRMSGR